MTDVYSRPYLPKDRSACLAIFDGNVPTFFAARERLEFIDCLDAVNDTDQPYLVLIRNGAIVACGGLYVEPGTRQARLSWGMVDHALHRQGLGRHLTEARLALARGMPGIVEIGLATSQHSQGFYARLGFAVQKVTPDGLAPGLDQWDMVLRLR